MTMVSYNEVLRAAHLLSRDAQAELAAALLRSLKPRPQDKKRTTDPSSLEPLRGMSTAELSVLAEAVVAPGKQASLQALMDKNRASTLTPEEEATLDDLLAQADQIGLLKARAQYTLSLAQDSGDLPE